MSAGELERHREAWDLCSLPPHGVLASEVWVQVLHLPLGNRLGAQAPGPPFPHLGSGCDDFGLKELEEVTNKMPADPAGVVSPKIHIYLEPQEVPLVWT